ncbi:hypothetical protein GFK82_00343 [Candidatus Steffania adelgidicola]|nr:hypothetical protein GFK82_00343 [Candidatus Steffania adelgidicola]
MDLNSLAYEINSILAKKTVYITKHRRMLCVKLKGKEDVSLMKLYLFW